MDHLLILLLVGLVAVVRKLFLEGGLGKILGKLDSDLNPTSSELPRPPMPQARRQVPATRPSPTSADPEAEQMRRYREALGLPPEESAPPIRREPPPQIKPIPQQPRTRPQTTRPRRIPEPPIPHFPHTGTFQAPPPRPDEEVKRYFGLDEVKNPQVPLEKATIVVPPLPTPPSENVSHFFDRVTPEEQNAAPSRSRLEELLGSGDLRRLILAQEILGRPKSLQNA